MSAFIYISQVGNQIYKTSLEAEKKTSKARYLITSICQRDLEALVSDIEVTYKTVTIREQKAQWICRQWISSTKSIDVIGSRNCMEIYISSKLNNLFYWKSSLMRWYDASVLSTIINKKYADDKRWLMKNRVHVFETAGQLLYGLFTCPHFSWKYTLYVSVYSFWFSETINKSHYKEMYENDKCHRTFIVLLSCILLKDTLLISLLLFPCV